MNAKARIVGLMVGIIVALAAFGCGKKTEEGEGVEYSERFRIPDSLIEAKTQYKLTRDDFHPTKGGVVANKHIEMHYPASGTEYALRVKTFGVLYEGYHMVAEAIGKPTDGTLVVIGAIDLDEYQLLTRKEWWYYGHIIGDTIYFEPYNLMFRRGIVDVTIPQKIAQLALIRRSGGKLPLWLRESIASYYAGEKDILMLYGRGLKMQDVDVYLSPDEIEATLAEATDMKKTRSAFYASFHMLERVLKFATMDDILGFADRLRDGASLDEASQASFGMDYRTLVDRVRIDKDKPKK